MSLSAAVMTARGTAAISTILLHGLGAADLLKQILRTSSNPTDMAPGNTLLGHIYDGDTTIDQVTVGCEGPRCFAIHCHGNPLIVEMIVKLLSSRGANLVNSDQMLAKTTPKAPNTIAIEARIALATVKTITGARIITSQIDSGLARTASRWLGDMNASTVESIGTEASKILTDSLKTDFVINGCTAVLVGPPNSGKSTLLNQLAGHDKAIVTDIPGTTRDYVTAVCLAEPLALTVIDTAGLDTMLAEVQSLEKTAQQAAIDRLEKADIALLVLDRSRPNCRIDDRLLELIAETPTVTILNKSDLPAKLDPTTLPQNLPPAIELSAQQSTGIDTLLQAVKRTLNVNDLDQNAPICFTNRQKSILGQLITAESPQVATNLITQLLEAPLCV